MRSDRRLHLLAIGAAGLLGAGRPVSAAAPVVAVVKSGAPLPFERATKAITAALRTSALRPEILTFDLEGDEAKGEPVFARVRSAKPALIITVGSLATASALAETAAEPIVFSMVLYPEQSGFTGVRRVTGASLDVPLDVQFRWVRRLLPAARRVGVLYHPAETGSVVVAAHADAAKHGLTLVAKSLGDRDDPVSAMRTLMENVDVVWSVADGHVFTPQATPALILASLRRRIPLVGLSTAHVRAGAFAALYADYDDVGEQTAALALRVLQGDAPSSLPVVTPRRVGLALNLRTADHLKLDVPADVAAEARETVR
jgi:putative ABC transport system substrate-binding protein